MFKKQVKCSECGFLGIHYELDRSMEISGQARLDIAQWYKEAHGIFIGCMRGQDYLIAGVTTPNDPIPIEDIVKNASEPRRCAYYYPYNPGYPPEQHLELQREAKTRRTLIVGMILAAVVGAIIGALISKLVT